MNHMTHPPNGQLSQWVLDLFPPGYRGHAVDVGASDGISINSTYALEKFHDWNVLSVEANSDFYPLLWRHRAWVECAAVADASNPSATFHVHTENPESFSSLKPNQKVAAGDNCEKTDFRRMTWHKIWVPVRTLDELLAKWEFPKLDALFVDTEGTELDVLKGLDIARWKPKVIVTECWEPVGPIDPYLESFGYKKTARNVHNDLFVRE